MKTSRILTAILCAACFWGLPATGHSITTLSVQFENTLHLISLNMPHKDVIETLGAPDVIKSDGMCLQYQYLGLSVFLNQEGRVEQIYLSRDFQGTVGNTSKTAGIFLSDIEREFGAYASVEKLNYQPSTLIQSKATIETENGEDPTGRINKEFPLQYRGNKKLYEFYNNGKILKYKYVLDDEGIAFWMDQDQKLYSTVLYLSKNERAGLQQASLTGPDHDAAITGPKRLAMVHFDFDKYNIKKIYVPILDQHMAYLREHPGAPLMVSGHTDAIGSDVYNQKLSVRRANAVRRYLIENGIASSRIKVRGYGKHMPIADNKTPEGRAMNRRAELGIVNDKQ